MCIRVLFVFPRPLSGVPYLLQFINLKKNLLFPKKNLSAMQRYEMLTIYFRNYNF